MTRPISVILLAAGKGTRMRSDTVKVLHPIAGRPLLHHALASTSTLAPKATVVVTSPGADDVVKAAQAAKPDAMVATQMSQDGTGDAVKAAREQLEGFEGDAIVLFADTPLIRSETFARIAQARNEADIVVLGFETPNPGRYGRLVKGEDGMLDRIVEAADATPDELEISTCNSGIIAADAQQLFALLDRVQPKNAQGEYYLTDIVGLGRAEGLTASVVICAEDETLGVNTREDLARAEAVFQTRARKAAMDNGVTLQDPQTIYFSADTKIAQDVTIGPSTLFGPGVTIESHARILGFCHLEHTHVHAGATIGPFARVRGGASIGEGAKIGNFVELKNAQLSQGVKASHLSYIGDTEVGEGANIGAGTITCNYDGVMKHRTQIGANAFIGSNSSLVAPVRIGDEALTGSGSVITEDVPDGALAVTRSPQKSIKEGARRLMARLRNIKAKKDAGS